MAAAAVVKQVGSSLSKNLREIRLHFCQTHGSSQGVRDFVHEHYVMLKKANPEFPILIRECSGVKPKLWVRYAFGFERSLPLENLNSQQVAETLREAIRIKP